MFADDGTASCSPIPFKMQCYHPHHDRGEKTMAGAGNWKTLMPSWNDSQTDYNSPDTQTSNYTSTPAIAFPVIRVAGSELERVLFQLYLSVNLLTGIVFNVLVLIAIARNRRLYTPENMIIGFDSLNNLILTVVGPGHMIYLISHDVVTYIYWLCQIAGILGNSAFSLTSYILLLYCLERYYFLCHPILYPRRITKFRIALLLLVATSISWIDAGFNSRPDRVLVITFLFCANRNPRVATITKVILYGVPCFSMTVFTVIKIKQLQSRSVGTTSTQNKAEKMRQKKRQISAIKTILLVSGVYFVMYLPMALMRLFIYLGGLTPLDLELRRVPAMSILGRWNNIAMAGTTSSVNPILYLWNRKGLKNSVLEMMPFLRCRKGRVNPSTTTGGG